MWRLAIIGIAAGGLSGLLGVGGGILMVPAFSAWLRLPLKETIATSLACVGIFAIPGTITHALLGHIDWAYAIPLVHRGDPRRAHRRELHDRGRATARCGYSVGARARHHRADLRGRRDHRAR